MMNGTKTMLACCLGTALLMGILGGCGTTQNAAAETTAAVTESGTSITLADGASTVRGSGATIDGNVLTVTAGGTYRLTGSLSDGRIVVNAPGEAVTLILDGVSVTCADDSPLYLYKAESVTLELADGSENTLTDGETYRFSGALDSAEDKEPDACLYARCDLTISGTGSLTVQGNCQNGITCTDNLTVTASSVTVNAVNHGIGGKDSLTIDGAAVTVVSGGDALRSNQDSDASLGWVTVTDAALHLTAGEDGIQAETVLTIRNTTAEITTGGGHETQLAEDASAKGLKAGTSLTVSGGIYTLDCSDDALHSNGDVAVTDGTLVLATGDDGIHAYETALVSGGTITVTACCEGIEGKVVDLSGGDMTITSSDDGLNAADGTASVPMQGNADCRIVISGGVIRIDASGDGVDSNGDFIMSGGELYVSGPENDSDSALDYDGTATITGGTVIAAGYRGMAQNFGSDSTQGSMLLTCTDATTEPITVTDEDGTVLASFTPGKRYDCVVVSTPELRQGGTYTVTAGGETTSVTLDSLIYGSSGGMNGGGFTGGGPGGQNGMTPPSGDPGGQGGQTPPSGDDGTPPQRPEDDGSFNPGENGGTPPAKPGDVQ